nr:zinc finger, CCHC-type [Tanacetum cinerariifolium]
MDFGLRNQHLKDFIKLVNSLDLNGKNKERTRMHLFQFSLRDQASNWLERLPVGSITTWEDLTTRFLAQFFPSGRTAKLRNDILIFQQHHGESLSEAWTHFKDLLQKVPHHGIDLWLQDKPSFNWGRTQTFTNPQNESIFVYSSSYQIKLEKKTVFEKLNDTSSLRNAGNFMSPKSIATIRHDEWEELKKKGIKSLTKLLSLKYLSSVSMKELNKNPSSPKHVHFANSIVILSTDNDTKEEDVSSTNACDLNLGGMEKREEGVKEQGKEENEMETDLEVDEVIKEESKFDTDEEVEEILKEEEDDRDSENFNLFPTMKELTHHEYLLKNPRPL